MELLNVHGNLISTDLIILEDIGLFLGFFWMVISSPFPVPYCSSLGSARSASDYWPQKAAFWTKFSVFFYVSLCLQEMISFCFLLKLLFFFPGTVHVFECDQRRGEPRRPMGDEPPTRTAERSHSWWVLRKSVWAPVSWLASAARSFLEAAELFWFCFTSEAFQLTGGCQTSLLRRGGGEWGVKFF